MVDKVIATPAALGLGVERALSGVTGLDTPL